MSALCHWRVAKCNMMGRSHLHSREVGMRQTCRTERAISRHILPEKTLSEIVDSPWMSRIFPTDSTTPDSDGAMTVWICSVDNSRTSIPSTAAFDGFRRVRGRLSGLGGSLEACRRSRALATGVTGGRGISRLLDRVLLSVGLQLRTYRARRRFTLSAGVRPASEFGDDGGGVIRAVDIGDGRSLRLDDEAESPRASTSATLPRTLGAGSISVRKVKRVA